MGLSNRQNAVLARLLAGERLDQAAAAIGVPYRTATRWAASTEFRSALEQARRDAITGALDTLAGAARDAARIVGELMRDASAPAGVRLRAAEGVLDRLTRWVELSDVIARVEALEGQLAGPGRVATAQPEGNSDGVTN